MHLSVILFLTICLSNKIFFTYVSARSANESGLIIKDLTKDIENHQIRQLSPQCWVHALEAVPYENHDNEPIFTLAKVSSGAKFCSFLEAETNKYFSLALTKCHFDDSGRNGLPLECYTTKNGSNIDIRSCTSKMSEETFLVYTKFLLHVNQICTKLTEDLKIQEQTIATAKFQQSAFEMQKKMEESFKIQEELQTNMKEQHELITLQKDFSRSMQHEMEDILRSLSQQQEYVLVQQDTIKRMKEIYEMSGIRLLQKRFHDVKDLVASFYMWFRYACILSVVITTCFLSRRLRRAKLIVVILATIEVISEYFILELVKMDIIQQDSGAIFIESLRSHDLLVYVLMAVLLVLLSFGKVNPKRKNSSENCEKAFDKYICSDTSISLDFLKENLRRERELYQIRDEQFQQQISELKRQLDESSRNIILASTSHRMQSSLITPSNTKHSPGNDLTLLLSRTPSFQKLGELDQKGQSLLVFESPPLASHVSANDSNIHNVDTVSPSPLISVKKRNRDHYSDDETTFRCSSQKNKKQRRV